MCICQLRKVQYPEVELTHCTISLKGRIIEEIGKRRVSRKGRMESEGITQTKNKTTRENATTLMKP